MKPVRVLVANPPRLMRELLIVMATIADQPEIELVEKLERKRLGRYCRTSFLAMIKTSSCCEAKQTPAPKPAPSGFYRTLLAITTGLSVQRGQALSRSKRVAVLAKEEYRADLE